VGLDPVASFIVNANHSVTGAGEKHKLQSKRQAGSDLTVPTLALPTNVAFSSTISRGASMSPCNVQSAWSSQRSVTKILPSTVPRTFTDFVLISPRMRACSPIVSVPVESIVPSTSPSMSSEFTNLTEPLIETPRERRAPDGVGMNVRLDGPGTTNGSGRFVCGGSVLLRGGKRVKGCMPRIVPNHSAFRKRNRFPHFRCDSRERNLFGQNRTLQLRNSARIVQTARFAFSPLTRSLPHVCGGIAQSHEVLKLGSIPVARYWSGTISSRLRQVKPTPE
jgi:hypothetical protein